MSHTELVWSFLNHSCQQKHRDTKQQRHRHMGSLMSIALTSSLAEDGDVLFQGILVPGVCPLVASF